MSHGEIRADLLSDTLTRPTEAMRRAMVDAPVGDDVFEEDPTVLRLQDQVAELLGHEAGLFTPTGSMANQLGVRLHVGPGQELVADSLAHVLRAELGAAAVLSGISSRTWVADRGRLRADQALDLMITGAGAYQVNTALVVVEDTHNFGGGTVQPLEEIRRLRAGTRAQGVAMHLDGARLWNAAVASGVELAEIAREFDTVSVCLSKGLGAPVGSVLVGSREAMREARVWRKRLGGGMRQVGILAAAGRYAVEHHRERLADDHARARRFAEAASAAAPGCIDPATVETNIVVLDTGSRRGGAVAMEAAERGVLVSGLGPHMVRAVTHLDVDLAACRRAGKVVGELLVP